MTPRAQALLFAAIALVAGTAGFLVARDGAAPGNPPSSVADRGVPVTLPDFTLRNREGELQSIRAWPGKSMIVNFWATWCAPCRREIPLLRELQATRGGDGYQVVGVAVDFREEVLEYATDVGLDYPLLIGEQDGLDAVMAFGVQAVGFPFTVFTDARGRVVTLHIGELTGPQAEIILAAVDRVNGGSLEPAAARREIASALEKLPAPPAEAPPSG